MNHAPDITNSTTEERRLYIKEKYPCIADCDMCGLCTAFHGKDAEAAYAAYIRGEQSFEEVSKELKRLSQHTTEDMSGRVS